MTLRSVQKLQLVWIVLGIGYNVISWMQQNAGLTPLTETNAVAGGLFIAFCGVVIIAGMTGATTFYKYAAPAIALLVSYAGVWLHISAYLTDPGLPGYSSVWSCFAAIGINTYGVVMMFIGTFLAWRTT